jgi:ribose 5-phosphate isomerase B
MIFIAADHGGYKLKEHLKKFLASEKLEFKDVGASKLAKDDDYPDYAIKAAVEVSKNPISNLAILICRSGQGMCIAANKFSGVRAALVWNTAEAKASRNDDMTNVLCLPSDYISPHTAENIVDTWLETPYSTELRHMRRVKKLSELDK